LVLQFGHPLVSALVPAWIAKAADACHFQRDRFNGGESGESGDVGFAHAVFAAGPPSLYDPVSTVTHSLSVGAADAVAALARLLQLRTESPPPAAAAAATNDNSDDGGGGAGGSGGSALLCLRALGHAALAAAATEIDGLPPSSAAPTPLPAAGSGGRLFAAGFGGGPAQALRRAQRPTRDARRGPLTEPWVARAVTRLMADGDPRGAVFVSASMPVRRRPSAERNCHHTHTHSHTRTHLYR
jgi:hypothetical protein